MSEDLSVEETLKADFIALSEIATAFLEGAGTEVEVGLEKDVIEAVIMGLDFGVGIGVGLSVGLGVGLGVGVGTGVEE